MSAKSRKELIEKFEKENADTPSESFAEGTVKGVGATLGFLLSPARWLLRGVSSAADGMRDNTAAPRKGNKQ